MFLGNPGEYFAVYSYAFLSWLIALPFFILMGLFLAIHRKHKQRRPMAIKDVWASLLCFAFSVISMWNIVRYIRMTWEWEWEGNCVEVLGILMILIPDILMLIISAVVTVASYKDIFYPLTPPPNQNNQI